MGHGTEWSAEDDALLRRELVNKSYATVADMLGRTVRACETRASLLGLRRGGRLPDWTDLDVAQLVREYPVMDTAVVAERLGRSWAAVRSKAGELNLTKTEEYRRQKAIAASRSAARKRTTSVFLQGRAGRFERDAGTWTPAQDAARHLQRIAPIWRCDAEGNTDPKGDHWKFSGTVMDAAAVEARAKRAGWVRA